VQRRDIALIGAAQQVEHQEIAVYGTLRCWAEILGLTADAAVLETIEEEIGGKHGKVRPLVHIPFKFQALSLIRSKFAS
jgi:hypothetical protein